MFTGDELASVVGGSTFGLRLDGLLTGDSKGNNHTNLDLQFDSAGKIVVDAIIDF